MDFIRLTLTHTFFNFPNFISTFLSFALLFNCQNSSSLFFSFFFIYVSIRMLDGYYNGLATSIAEINFVIFTFSLFNLVGTRF